MLARILLLSLILISGEIACADEAPIQLKIGSLDGEKLRFYMLVKDDFCGPLNASSGASFGFFEFVTVDGLLSERKAGPQKLVKKIIGGKRQQEGSFVCFVKGHQVSFYSYLPKDFEEFGLSFTFYSFRNASLKELPNLDWSKLSSTIDWWCMDRVCEPRG